MSRRRKKEPQERQDRIDKKHRFPLRINPDLHNEADCLTFKFDLSLNLLYNECIHFAMQNAKFLDYIERTYQTRVNPRRGHFIYIRDWEDGR